MINPTIRAPRQQEWAVLVYTSSTPDIEAATTSGLQELSERLDGSVAVAIQRGLGGQALRLEATPGHLEEVAAPVTADMSQPQTLSDFLKWGMQRYPAKHYAVVVGGHGAGFLGCVTNSAKSRMMRLPDLRQALEAAPRKPDVIAFNTCLMGCSEAAVELQNTATTLVATQAGENGQGMPLGEWIAALPHCQNAETAALALVDKCAATPDRTTHVSAFATSALPAYGESLDKLSRQILENPQARPELLEDLKAVSGYWEHPWDFALFRQVDVGQLCERFSQDQRLPEDLRQAARETSNQARGVVLNKAGGISLFAPEKAWEMTPMFDKKMGEVYADLRLAKSTGWDEALHSLSA